MRLAISLSLGLLLLGLAPVPAAAQDPDAVRTFRFDISGVGVGGTWMRQSSPTTYTGLSIGAGVQYVAMPFGRESFYWDGTMLELAHFAAFRSLQAEAGIRMDYGLRASVLFNSAGDLAHSGFAPVAAVFVAPTAGSRRVRIGPMLEVCVMYAEGDLAPTVLVKPLVLSVDFPR
jgi:hypothetical protein